MEIKMKTRETETHCLVAYLISQNICSYFSVKKSMDKPEMHNPLYFR